MNPNALSLLSTVLLGFFVFVVLIPHEHRAQAASDLSAFGRFIRKELRRFRDLSQIGGYVHDTAMAQFIPVQLFHIVTGTWTYIAGQVAGTVCAHKAATAETSTINIPIIIPSNSSGNKGALLKDVEIDYEILVAACTSVTLSIVKVVRGADGADAVVSAPAGTQTLTPATTAATVDEHRDRFTLTTPAYIDDDEVYFLKVVYVAAATSQIDILGAVAYYTERL